jgi:preprotein translocase subunit SecE
VARDRKRAKQRRASRGLHGAARPDAPDGGLRPDAPDAGLHRADLPGALEHASSEVDEFDAALVRGARGVPMPSEDLDSAADASLDGPGDSVPVGASASAPAASVGGGSVPPRPRSSALAASFPSDESASASAAAALPGTRRGGRRLLLPRALAFLRASWAELQRVQWPDRTQVSQATTVVLGFVAVAGVYLGAADWVAQKIVNFVL